MAGEIDSNARLRRAQYRASHRGTKEMDILLGRFADAELADMNDDELEAFETMLALPDPDIDHWIRHGGAPERFADLILRIRKFHSF